MKEIFYELIKEAKEGNVTIDNDKFEIAFNTRILEKNIHYYNEQNLAELVIKDEKTFFSLLEEYIKLELEKNRKIPNFLDKKKSPIKWIMSYLFINATTEDFLNPERLIRRRIAYLQDKTFDYLSDGIEIEVNEVLNNSCLHIKKSNAPVAMETPNIIELSLNSEENGEYLSYKLPSIYYGISDGTCYIYSVMNPKEKSNEKSLVEEKYIKKMKRLLFKLNAGVPPKEKPLSEEENITDVTPSFVFALNIFLSLLKKEKIEKIKIVTYLPLRYSSRMIFARGHNNEAELLEKNDFIQKNATDKLIRTFRRIAHHDKSIVIDTFPYEIDEYLTIRLLPVKEKIENQILNATAESIIEGGHNK